ncbi:Ankyrin repeat protein [Cedratvirus A11]|uniref:Ankyrin repeat protein n=1 Tax=Cedratvirus A11 TaxID=1903266 RepID=A0A1M7XVJ0_9VIRU|nr:Ankyrin repeat protein [Cedratvirus A11]SHO33548.1 Ankyrin repeat protein [Cedratvirus A11]
MHLSDLPVENLKNICSFLGGDSYAASLVPYLRSCVENPDRREFMVEVYKRQDFAFIYLYNLFPTYDVVERCVSTSVKRENLTILSWLLAKSNNQLLLMIGEQAARHGSYKVLTWAMYQGCPVTVKMVTDVVRAGNIILYKLLHFLGHRYRESINQAALLGHLDILYLSEIYHMGDVCYNLAAGGHLQELNALFYEGALCLDEAMKGAYSTLQREIVVWFKDNCDLASYVYSALLGKKSEEEKLAFLQFLDGLVQLNHTLIAGMSLCLPYMSIIRWCLDKGARADAFIFAAACMKSTQDMDYLHSLGCYRGSSTLYFSAIGSRKVENLEWLRKKGCPIPQDLTRHALQSKGQGSLIPCFEWCLKQGLNFSTKLLQDCILQEEMDLFHWLLDKVSLSDEHLMWRCLQTSIHKPNLEAFSILHDHEKMAREEIEKKKETYSNYLLLEEMERLLG